MNAMPLNANPLNAMTLIVMYHYVRPRDARRWGGLFPLSPEEFEQQLDAFEALGDIVPVEALRAPRTSVGRPRIILTFDDGTRDHYTNVFPVLQRRGLRGLFGVISSPTVMRRMPTTHMAHVLLSKVEDETVWEALVARFSTNELGDEQIAHQRYSRDTPCRARVKYAINFALHPSDARLAVEACLLNAQVDLRQLTSEWFLTEAQIREMHSAGMDFALHATQHHSFAPPADQFFTQELEPCETWLTRLLGARPRYYIPAFGGQSGVTQATGPLAELARLLQRRGYERGFTTESGVESDPGTRFFLKRVDAADLPPRGVLPGALTCRVLQSAASESTVTPDA